MPRLTPLAAIACSLLSGCGGVRVVAIPTTQPRQLAETVYAYVYIETANGQRIKSTNRTPLYEGEWVLSDPGQ
jgi:uncharacterized protein YceK